MRRLQTPHTCQSSSNYPRRQHRPRWLMPIALVVAITVGLAVAAISGHTQTSYAQQEREVIVASLQPPIHQAPNQNELTTALSAPPVGIPTLRWTEVGGAKRYNVQISTSEGFASTLVNQNTTATTYTHREVFADGTYFWRVRVETTEGWSNFSSPWSFRKDWSAEATIKPILLAPADDPGGQQPITNFTPEHFSWEPVVGAASYVLEISLSPSFNEAKPYRITTIKTHHTPTKQFTNNQYYWRVIPLDADDNAGEAIETRTFTFAWNQIPELLLPEDDLDARFIPRLSWTAVPGASSYILEISSQENFSELVLNLTTRNTSYTAEQNLANNTDYFWRVRAISPQKVNGPPSIARRFRTNWVQPPVLLSPPVRSIHHIYPYFSWTPIAGAEKYQIQIATGNGFSPPLYNLTLVNATAYTQPEWKEINFGADYFWRVRAIDAQGNTTNWSSEQTFRFAISPPPNLIYPEPYYDPDVAGMPVHTNRTIDQPIFVWDTTHQYNGGNGPLAFTYPDFYRLEVSPARDFNPIVYAVDSAGPAASPTLENPFNNLVDGTLYYWRVTPYRDGVPQADGTVWETRIDRTRHLLPFDSDSVPDISHPREGNITVESAPILGWLPVVNAAHYEVRIATDRNFTQIVENSHPIFTYYVPWQENITTMPSGTYWWQVRALDAGGNALGDWSPSRHFYVMKNLMTGSDYDYELPNPGTLLSLGDPQKYDPTLSQVATSTLMVDAPYNVGSLHVAQDRSLSPLNLQWVIAFGADSGITQTLTYALYFDVNQRDQVGGTTDPRGKPISFDALYQPEYVIYLERENDAIVAAWLHEWRGTEWSVPFALSGLGGSYAFDATSQAVQVVFPYSAIILDNSDQFSGGLALTVYSTESASNAAPISSIPAQEQLGVVNRPAFFSNMPVPLFPFDTPLTNPIVFHEMPSLRWRMPYYNSTDGYIIQVARNPNFTQDNIIETWETYESGMGSFYGAAPTAFHTGKAYNDDESYYWRVRYRHERYGTAGQYDASPWSQPVRFKLTSYQPGNAATTLGNIATGEAAQATPSFTWDRVEGAARYSIQIDNDFNMNSPLIDKLIDGNSHTPVDTLPDGTYYWRVAIQRSRNVLGQWTSTMSFTKSSLVPTPISPISNTIINEQPTFMWEATITNTGELHIAAPRYRLQWDDNPQFNKPTTIETEATSYTPQKGQSLADGTWYWRVAVIDGSGKLGPDSAVAIFYKEYLRPQPILPVQGSKEAGNLTFEWEPLQGASSYKLEIDDNEAFDSPIRVTTENTRYTHIDTLKAGDYYWRVQMVDRDNKPGPTIPGRFSLGTEIYMPSVKRP